MEDKKEQIEQNKKEEKQDQQEQKQQENQEEMNEVDLDNAFDQFEDKLNLTGGEEEIKNQLNGEIEKEYQKFMENINQEDEQIPQFQNMFSELLQGLSNLSNEKNENINSTIEEDNKSSKQNLEELFKNLQSQNSNMSNMSNLNMDDMMGNFENNPQFENFANNLLNEFMDKEIIYEPLQDADKEYESFLNEHSSQIKQEDLLRYQQQQQQIKKIIKQLDENPNQKDKIIQMFEEMQDFGNPPDSLQKSMGKDSPFAMFNKNSNNNQEQNQDCVIF